MQICFGRPVPVYLPLKYIFLALKFTATLLVQWVLWMVSAIADAFDDRAGDQYQSGVLFIFSCALSLIYLVLDALYSAQVVTFWWSVMVGFSIYLFFGMCYFWHERRWG